MAFEGLSCWDPAELDEAGAAGLEETLGADGDGDTGSKSVGDEESGMVDCADDADKLTVEVVEPGPFDDNWVVEAVAFMPKPAFVLDFLLLYVLLEQL